MPTGALTKFGVWLVRGSRAVVCVFSDGARACVGVVWCGVCLKKNQKKTNPESVVDTFFTLDTRVGDGFTDGSLR